MAARKRAPGQSKDTHQTLGGFSLNAIDDAPDFRDFAYQPALLQLSSAVNPPKGLTILNQGTEGSCTGMALAAVINLLVAERGGKLRVSARMLYEMAKKYDEWDGADYSGSSCRGAIRGWHSMGVCTEMMGPYVANKPDWQLSIAQAEDARQTTLGAYFRVSKRLSDFHAALNEANALFVSARVHKGWKSTSLNSTGVIPYQGGSLGGHAFAIVGYNGQGFWVQNSWGKAWGKNGIALWTYEDWLENLRDAWVVRLALSTPQVWHLTPTSADSGGTEEGLFKGSPKRAEIAGHFVHIDDGDFDRKGKYWADENTIEQTADLVAKSTKYDHLLLYAHGGLNSIKASARRIVAMKEVFKNNRIYPFHFMYDTGLLEEIKDLVIGKKKQAEERTRGFSDFTDRLIEGLTRHGGRAIWREMKLGANRPFSANGAGTFTIGAFLGAMSQKGAVPKKMHLVGHSTGAILLASLLDELASIPNAPRVTSCSLLAPACTHDRFNAVYRPLVKQRSKDAFGINKLRIFDLEDRLERKDTVTPLYRKSLLYLVSNAFEEQRGDRILGMHKFSRYLRGLPGGSVFQIHTSDGVKARGTRTRSVTHGGFDNDVETMNSILKLVLGGAPEQPFSEADLDY